MFKRRNAEQPVEIDEAAIEGFEDDLDPEDRALEDAELLAELARQEALEVLSREPARPQGPWDVEDAPADERPRIDLGGMAVPVPEDVEVRVDVSPEGEVVAATLVRGESAMQLNAFAAPRKSGIWEEVRQEIGEALRQGGGSAEEAPGPHGTELVATVPTEVPGQGVALMPARFLGVDGPRWFLRALITGPAARDAALAAPFEAALRDVVVVRGNEPMAVRDPLPLALPKEVMEQASQQQGGAGDDAAADGDEPARPTLPLPQRGPEITEIR